MTPLFLLLLAVFLSHPPRPPQPLRVHELATLTDAEARALHGRRIIVDIVLAQGEVNDVPETGWHYKCHSADDALRTLWLPNGEDVEAVSAERGSGVLRVEATFRRIVHRQIIGPDGRTVPGFVE
jgi:hypothetical protein